MFQVQLWLITKQSTLRPFNHTMSLAGVMALLCSLLPDRGRWGIQENWASHGIISWERYRIGQVYEMMSFVSPLKIKTERPYFSQTTSRDYQEIEPHLSREQIFLLIYFDEITPFFLFFPKSPYLGQLLFQMSWESFWEHSCNSTRQGTAFFTQYLTEAGRKSLGYRLSLSLFPVDSTSELFRLPCLPRDTRRRGNGQEL